MKPDHRSPAKAGAQGPQAIPPVTLGPRFRGGTDSIAIGWHDGPLDTLIPGNRIVVWSGTASDRATTQAIAATRATPDDLADAAPHPDGASRLVRRRLARALVARLAGVPVEDVWISRSSTGAPIVVAPTRWYIGQSGRSGEWLIAAARQPVAVDREPIDDAAPLRDMLSPAERRAHGRLAPGEQPLDWLRRWTIKEAHAKLIGDPLRIRPEAIETRLDGPATATATFEGVSQCWTRKTATALETVAMWA